MEEKIAAAYRLTLPGATSGGSPSDVAETTGSPPVQNPVLAVATVELPLPLEERLAVSSGTEA